MFRYIVVVCLRALRELLWSELVFFFTALLLQRQIKVRQSGGMEIASAQYIKKGFIETVLSDTDANLATFEHLNKRFSGLITPYVTRRDELWHLTGDGRGTAAA